MYSKDKSWNLQVKVSSIQTTGNPVGCCVTWTRNLRVLANAVIKAGLIRSLAMQCMFRAAQKSISSVNVFFHISKFIQERTDNADKRRQDIEKANKKHAELKKKRDNTTNSRK